MKTLLIILIIATQQLFALNVYSNNKYSKEYLADFCIFKKAHNNPIFFAISATGPFQKNTFNTKACTLFNDYNTTYTSTYNSVLPLLLTSQQQAKLGFIPIYYEIQFKLQAGENDASACAGSLFALEPDSVVVLTAKHCIEPLDTLNTTRSIIFLQEGIHGTKYNSKALGAIDSFEYFKERPTSDAAKIIIKNKELNTLAKNTNSFENFKQQTTLDWKKIDKIAFYPNGPAQLFFFGGDGYYKGNSYDNGYIMKRAVSAAYLFTESSQRIFNQPNLNKDSDSITSDLYVRQYSWLYTSINNGEPLDDGSGLYGCKGDSGGAIVQYSPSDNKYLFLGIITAGYIEYTISNQTCGNQFMFLPVTSFLTP